MKIASFPEKFGGDMNRHYEIHSEELRGIHARRVLELATGSGGAVNFLPDDNRYTSEEDLKSICKDHGLSFETIPAENGALLCLRAILQ